MFLFDLDAPCSGTHRGPQGPNEDIGICGVCGSPSYSVRPDGESFGWHTADCSLPMNHESYCKPGGTGHTMPEGWKLRG